VTYGQQQAACEYIDRNCLRNACAPAPCIPVEEFSDRLCIHPCCSCHCKLHLYYLPRPLYSMWMLALRRSISLLRALRWRRVETGCAFMNDQSCCSCHCKLNLYSPPPPFIVCYKARLITSSYSPHMMQVSECSETQQILQSMAGGRGGPSWPLYIPLHST
jgi:hypothetical protein